MSQSSDFDACMSASPPQPHPAASPELVKKRRFFLIVVGLLLTLQAVGLVLFISKIDFRTPLNAAGEPVLKQPTENDTDTATEPPTP